MATSLVTGENIRRIPAAPALDWGRVLLAVVAQVEVWTERRGQRLSLAELTEAQLKDIGLTAADVARETAKPFWEA